jgi:hypothetical protein
MRDDDAHLVKLTGVVEFVTLPYPKACHAIEGGGSGFADVGAALDLLVLVCHEVEITCYSRELSPKLSPEK